nr:Rap1a/Tai family immunity protein [uncultured Glaciecola sp.]
MKALLIASVLLIISFSSHAMTGNELFEKYREYQKLHESRHEYSAVGAGFYQGFVRGVVVTYLQAGLICLDGSITFGQVDDIVGKELTDNPSNRNQIATEIIAELMIKSFPCEE